MLPAETDLRLTIYAKKKGMDRSAVVVLALGELLKGISVRFPGEPAGEDATDA